MRRAVEAALPLLQRRLEEPEHILVLARLEQLARLAAHALFIHPQGMQLGHLAGLGAALVVAAFFTPALDREARRPDR